MTYTTIGIVLQKRDFRESDRIYTIYTPDHGKLELVGKGTRKIISKMASHLEPPSFVEFMVAEGKAIDYVAGVRRLASYSNIRGDFETVFVFSRVASFFDKEVKLGQKDDFLYSALTRFLEELGAQSTKTLTSDAFLTLLTNYTSHGIVPRLG